MAAARKEDHSQPGPILPLLYQKLFEHYSKYSPQLQAEIPVKLAALEKTLEPLKDKILPDKLPIILKAKKLLEEIVSLDEKNYFIYMVMGPIFALIYQLSSDEKDKKKYLEETIAIYDKALNLSAAAGSFSSEAWIFRGYLLLKSGNQNKAKEYLLHVLDNGKLDIATFPPHIIYEYLLPISEGLDSVNGLGIRIKWLLWLMSRKEIKHKKKFKQFRQHLEHDILALMKRCRITDINLNLPEQERTFLKFSVNHDGRERKILTNRIELLCRVISNLSKEKNKNEEEIEDCKDVLKKEVLAYSLLKSGSIPNLQPKDVQLILTLIHNETDSYVILQKAYLKGGEKIHVISALGEVAKNLKVLQESKSAEPANKAPEKAHKQKIVHAKRTILELELLYIQILHGEIERAGEEFANNHSKEIITNYKQKLTGLIDKLEKFKSKQAEFQVYPRENKNSINPDQLLKNSQEQNKLLDYFAEDIAAGTVTLDDIKFFSIYRSRQEKIYESHNIKFELNESHYKTVLLHNKGKDLVARHESLEAIPILAKALMEDPYYCFSMNELAKAYAMAGELDQAITASETSIQIYPTDQAFVHLAACKYKLDSQDESAASDLLWALCLNVMQKDNASDNVVNILAYFYRDNSIEKLVVTAQMALADRNYFEAFKLYSIAIWKNAFSEEKEKRRTLHLSRLFCLSLLANADAVVKQIMEYDWYKILVAHVFKKMREDEYVRLFEISKILLDDQYYNSFARQILQTIAYHLPEAMLFLINLDNPTRVIANPHKAGEAAETKDQPAQSAAKQQPMPVEVKKAIPVDLTPIKFSDAQEVKTTIPVDLTPIKFSDARERRNRLKQEKAQAESAAKKAKQQEIISEAQKELERERQKAFDSKKATRLAKVKRRHAKEKAHAISRKKQSVKESKDDNATEIKETNNDLPGPTPSTPIASSTDVITTLLESAKDDKTPSTPENEPKDYTLKLPLNLVRRLKFILKTLGEDEAFITGGAVEKIVLGKQYDFARDFDFVTKVQPVKFLPHLPGLTTSKKDFDKRTYIWPASLNLNIPRIELFYRKFLLIDPYNRNFVSKTLRIIALEVTNVADADAVESEPINEDRDKMVEICVSIWGLPEAFKAIKDKKLRLPPGITPLRSFTTDATRILQAVTICCKDDYSDDEIDLQSYVYLIGKIITDPENEKLFKSLKKEIAEAFRCGFSAAILKRWIELSITQYLFKNLHDEIAKTVSFTENILAEQDQYNNEHPEDRQLNYSIVALFAAAIYYKYKGELDAPTLAEKVSETLENNPIFTEFGLAKNLIAVFIVGDARSNPGEKLPTLFEKIRDHFKAAFINQKQQQVGPPLANDEQKALPAPARLTQSFYALNNIPPGYSLLQVPGGKGIGLKR